jgi:hypothetical protein
MAVIAPRPRPEPEAITWDGSNDVELLDLVYRVADLHVWAPLESTPFNVEVSEEAPHVGLCISNDIGQIVARIETGNSLVFDLFATTPLFVVTPDELAAFYEVDA